MKYNMSQKNIYSSIMKKGHSQNCQLTNNAYTKGVIGGVMKVDIKETKGENGQLKLKLETVPKDSNRGFCMFVAGGPEIDRIIESVNANLPIINQTNIIETKKEKPLKKYLFNKLQQFQKR